MSLLLTDLSKYFDSTSNYKALKTQEKKNVAVDHKLNYWLIQDLLKNFTCPTTGFWQVEQFPLEEAATPCLLRSDWRRPNMLSNEPSEDAGGGEAVCCGEDATCIAG